MDFPKFDKFVVALQDKGILQSATFTENANKITYKLVSGKTTLLAHVKEGEVLLQKIPGNEILQHIRSNALDRLLPKLVSQVLFPAQNFKTPFGLFQGVHIAPVAKKVITSSATGVDPTNGEIYQDNYLFVNDNGNIAVYVKYADDWNLLRSFETRAEAVLFCDKLTWNLSHSGQAESEDMANENGENVGVVEDFQDEGMNPEIEEAAYNDISADLEEYALPEEIEEFEENPSLETLPKAEDLEFMTSSGKRFIVSHDESQVTLGLYNLLRNSNAEEALLLMPTLKAPANTAVKVREV